MKSVILSAVLVIVLIVFCLFVKTHTLSRIDALYEMSDALPATAEEYQSSQETHQKTAQMLGDDWSDAVGYLSYVCGYSALNRADEAVWNLYAAVRAEDWSTAIAARYQLLDALRRMRELETVTFSSVF